MAKPRTKVSDSFYAFQVDSWAAKARVSSGEVFEIHGQTMADALVEFIKSEASDYYYDGDTTYWYVVDPISNVAKKVEAQHFEVKEMNARAKVVD